MTSVFFVACLPWRFRTSIFFVALLAWRFRTSIFFIASMAFGGGFAFFRFCIRRSGALHGPALASIFFKLCFGAAAVFMATRFITSIFFTAFLAVGGGLGTQCLRACPGGQLWGPTAPWGSSQHSVKPQAQRRGHLAITGTALKALRRGKRRGDLSCS